jgi:GNAT superfamily N-acetyltransferase
LARLCGQLGYPVASEALRQRLAAVEESGDHTVYVAATPDGHVIGWVQVCARRLLLAGRLAEIEGLVVDQRHRRLGVGQRLMAQAEDWARSRGCEGVQVRSNVLRPEAREFYPALGYENYKTSRVYRKAL